MYQVIKSRKDLDNTIAVVSEKETLEEELKFFTENNSPEMHLMKCAVEINFSLATKDLDSYKISDKDKLHYNLLLKHFH